MFVLTISRPSLNMGQTFLLNFKTIAFRFRPPRCCLLYIKQWKKGTLKSLLSQVSVPGPSGPSCLKELLKIYIQLPPTFNSVNAQVMLFLLVKPRYVDQSTFFNKQWCHFCATDQCGSCKINVFFHLENSIEQINKFSVRQLLWDHVLNE